MHGVMVCKRSQRERIHVNGRPGCQQLTAQTLIMKILLVNGKKEDRDDKSNVVLKS